MSIVIPAYNDENHLKTCLESIARQTVMPDEVIVVDNNSTDDTAKVARRYRFVRVIREKKQGIVHARNAGFNAAKSDIIGRIDADTILPATWVNHVKQFYGDPAHKTHAISGGGHFYNLVTPRLNGWLLGQVAYRLNRLLIGHYILWGANMAIPAKVWKKIKNDTCLLENIHEDLDLAIHAHRKGYAITYHENLRVGVMMRRVFSDRHALYENLMLWPQTLKVHRRWTWVIGWIGAWLLYAGSFWLAFAKKE